MIVIELLLIEVIVVYIIDLSGFIDSLKHPIAKYLKVPPQSITLKPIDCSLCSTWWTCIIYLLITGNFTLPYIAVSAILSFFSPVVRDLIKLMFDTAVKGIDWLYERI